MKYRLEWFKDNSRPTFRVGICEELPDAYCNFTIEKLSPDLYQAIPPTLIIESTQNKLLFREYEIAQDFCEDFLNHNLKSVLRHQISNMKGSNAPTQKSVRYYENLMDQILHLEATRLKKRQ
ncbi:MAG: hypothetical protein HYZ14_15395 [Bacteroidetes bacterium]|nr:hypothetical protein [Bacteroidota bacterium]